MNDIIAAGTRRDARDPDDPRSRLEIQSLLKGLRIIEALNETPGMILAQVAATLGLPRTTAHRALRTLVQHEYIYRDEATARYYVDLRVRGLASGIDPVAEMTIRARREFERLGAEVQWPMHLSTPQLKTRAPQMRVQASTDFVAPLAVEKLLPGASIPLLQCAAGLACVAALPANERGAVIEQALNAPNVQFGQVRWTQPALEAALERAQREGVAVYRRPMRHTQLIGLSVPIMSADHAIAAVSVRFAESALPEREGRARFLPMLRAMVERVGGQAAAAQSAGRAAAAAS